MKEFWKSTEIFTQQEEIFLTNSKKRKKVLNTHVIFHSQVCFQA